MLLQACTDKKAESNRLVKAGTIKLYQSDFHEALDDFLKAAEYNPKNAEAYFNIGNVYMNLMDYEKAIKYYTQAIQIKQDYADAYYNRGMVQFYLGEYDLACDDWRMAEKYGKTNVSDRTRHCK